MANLATRMHQLQSEIMQLDVEMAKALRTLGDVEQAKKKIMSQLATAFKTPPGNSMVDIMQKSQSTQSAANQTELMNMWKEYLRNLNSEGITTDQWLD
jgi:hypothetical protein